MNWVDLVVIAVLAVSGLLAFIRGLLREVLAIAAWAGAGFFADWAGPLLLPRVQAFVKTPDYAMPAAYLAAFAISLIFLTVVASMIGKIVRASGLGGIDRTLGVVFGLLRGAAIIVFAYIGAGIIVETDRWPAPVLDARSLPLAYEGAVWVAGLMPEAYRPHVTPPPAGRDPRAADLLHATPQGRALGRP